MRPLTPKQQAFVEQYLVDRNGTQAAIRAGYAPKAAQEQASRLLSNAMVAAAIAEAGKKASAKVELDVEWVLRGIKENYERAMQAEPVRDREGNPTGEYQYAGAVANKALEMAGRYNAMFKDKTEHTVTGTGSLEDMLALLPAAVAALTGKK